MNADTDQFQMLTAEVTRLAGLVNVLVVRVEETLAAAFPPISPAARPAPARQARRHSARPGYLRSVGGGES